MVTRINNYEIYVNGYQGTTSRKKTSADKEISAKINVEADGAACLHKHIFKTDKTNCLIEKILDWAKHKVDSVGNVETTVQFNQYEIINGSKELPTKLMLFNLKFNGLCELICNKVLIDDLLGKGDGNFLKERINISGLNKVTITNSHLLNVYSIFHRMAAFLFGVYPDNIFSFKDQWNLVKKSNSGNKVNESLLIKGVAEIKAGTVVKLEIFSKSKTSFSGHSLLVKKVKENEFIFFDPNTGEHRGLSKKDLVQKIDDQLSKTNGTDIFLSKGESFLKRLIDRKILKVAKESIVI